MIKKIKIHNSYKIDKIVIYFFILSRYIFASYGIKYVYKSTKNVLCFEIK